MNLETLASDEMNLANLSLCLICGRNFNVETTNNGMIDINTLIDIPGELVNELLLFSPKNLVLSNFTSHEKIFNLKAWREGTLYRFLH